MKMKFVSGSQNKKVQTTNGLLSKKESVQVDFVLMSATLVACSDIGQTCDR